MVNIFRFDIDKYDMGEIKQMFDAIKKILPEEDELIAIPNDTYLYQDIPFDMLCYYRDLFNNLIEERQRSNWTKNDL